MLRADHFGHLIIGALATAGVGLALMLAGMPGGVWVGWALAVGAMYGREQRDAELHWQSESRENLATAERRWRVWLPWKWGWDGRMDFGWPLASATATALALEGMRWALGRWPWATW